MEGRLRYQARVLFKGINWHSATNAVHMIPIMKPYMKLVTRYLSLCSLFLKTSKFQQETVNLTGSISRYASDHTDCNNFCKGSMYVVFIISKWSSLVGVGLTRI